MQDTANGLSDWIVPRLTLKDPMMLFPGATPMFPVFTVVNLPLNVIAVPACKEKDSHCPSGMSVAAARTISASAMISVVVVVITALFVKKLW